MLPRSYPPWNEQFAPENGGRTLEIRRFLLKTHHFEWQPASFRESISWGSTITTSLESPRCRLPPVGLQGHRLVGILAPYLPADIAVHHPGDPSKIYFCLRDFRGEIHPPTENTGFNNNRGGTKILRKNNTYRGYWKESLRCIFHWKHWNGKLKKYLDTSKNRWMQCRSKPISPEWKGG